MKIYIGNQIKIYTGMVRIFYLLPCLFVDRGLCDNCEIMHTTFVIGLFNFEFCIEYTPKTQTHERTN